MNIQCLDVWLAQRKTVVIPLKQWSYCKSCGKMSIWFGKALWQPFFAFCTWSANLLRSCDMMWQRSCWWHSLVSCDMLWLAGWLHGRIGEEHGRPISCHACRNVGRQGKGWPSTAAIGEISSWWYGIGNALRIVVLCEGSEGNPLVILLI